MPSVLARADEVIEVVGIMAPLGAAFAAPECHLFQKKLELVKHLTK